MQFTQHALAKIGTDADLHRAVFLAATDPQTRYESRRNGGGMRHVRGDVVAIVDRGAVITFYRNVEETALRPDQTDDDALAFQARQARETLDKGRRESDRKIREQKRNVRRDRDRALTQALKGKKA
jgi:hypothetical protein